MAKAQRSFVCQTCGAAHAKWAGRCEDCGAWNSIVEEAATKSPSAAAGGKANGRRLDLVSLEGSSAPPPRLPSGIEELDRVLGGGIVPGAVLLIGGDPGIGKSTLMLQAAAALADKGREVVYVSGEESVDQIRLRALRLGLAKSPVRLASATSVGDILATVDHHKAPALVVVDSIQTMWVDGLEQAPGTVTQLRAAAQGLIRFAKHRGSALMLIGHVTKDGQIAGPRVLEHMVDAVLYFEGERGHQFRILRAVKNRFGPANEIGVFEMAEAGLVPVPNPSALFLADREDGVAGAAVFAGMEGSRPLLVEIQALVAPSGLATPRRAVVGWDGNRLAMLLAVLEARCGLVMSTRDVYLNVAGGLRVQEPAADLAVAAAIISSELGRPAPPASVFFGEVGLAGEVRAVGHIEARLKEAGKLGFERAIMPRTGKDRPAGLAGDELARLADLVGLMGGGPLERRRKLAS
jgi:DNA repair protein RadA/Sms